MQRSTYKALATLLVPALLLTLVAALLGRALLARAFREPPPATAAPPPVAAAPPPEEPALPAVLEIGGAVEREDADGSWRALRAGDALVGEAAIRTGGRSWARIAVGPTMRVKLDADTTVRVRRPAGREHRLAVSRGRIDVDAPAEAVRVEVGGRAGAVARAEDARFSVLATEAGVAVAATRGAVALSAGGAEVTVGAGEGAASVGGAPPAPARPLSAELLLRVARGAGASCERVAGRVEPGAEVRVNGQLVPTGPDGSFVAAVPRRRADRAILLAVRDAAGRQRERSIPCEDDPDIQDLRVRWGR